MNTIGIGLKALKDIIDNRKPVHLVMESLNTQYNLSANDKLRLRRTVNGSMRHFFLLRYEATKAFSRFAPDDDEIYLLIFALYEIKFSTKTIAPFQVINEAIEASELLGLRLEPAELDRKLTELARTRTRMPAALKKDFYEYNSLFFSAPVWLIRMWTEQYGDDICMNLLHASQAKHPIYVRLNSLKSSLEELLSEDIYINVANVAEALIYHAPHPLSSQEDAKKGKVFAEDLSLQMLSDSLSLKPGDRVLQLHGVTGALSSNIAIRLSSLRGVIEANFESEMLYRKARYQYERLGLSNARAYLSDLGKLRDYCRYGSYDVCLVTPESSYLGQLSRRPGLMAVIRESDLASSALKERQALEEGAKYIKPSGMLVYSVQTINLEEGERLIQAFLAAHPEFALSESHQIFPYDFASDGIYYALLKRAENGR